MRQRIRMLAPLALIPIVNLLIATETRSEPQVPETSHLTAFEAAMRSDLPGLNEASAASGRPRDVDLVQVIKLASADGFRRLDDSALVEMMHLRNDLAQHADPRTCSDLWSGENSEAVIAGIEASSPPQQHQWARLFDDAALAAIRNHPPLRPPPAASEVHLAMRRLLQAMPPPDQLAMLDLTADGAHPTANEQCQGVKLFYGRMEKMDVQDALIIIRSSLYH